MSPSGEWQKNRCRVGILFYRAEGQQVRAIKFAAPRCVTTRIVQLGEGVSLNCSVMRTKLLNAFLLLSKITGVAIAVLFDRLDISKLGLRSYALVSAALLASSMSMYRVLPSFGVDPMWSVSLARRHCLRQDWVHLDTTLLYSFVRDSSAPLG